MTSSTSPQTTVGRATAILRARIVSGSYPPEAPLPLLQSLAASLDVGMQSLHEALGRLAAEGLIARGIRRRPYVLTEPATPSPVARVAHHLRSGVADGVYAPGQEISVFALVETMGVSWPVAELGCTWARHEGYLRNHPCRSGHVLIAGEPADYCLPEPPGPAVLPSDQLEPVLSGRGT
ncbi:GntR family transcriptional regulator [Streptomyces sp. CA-294286]|uniref:GntR family transcriptional regulator n=1 Tax=Streptomyces sp. CA-294286 TaxID=3240070 RepID=UPI003D8CD55F